MKCRSQKMRRVVGVSFGIVARIYRPESKQRSSKGRGDGLPEMDWR